MSGLPLNFATFYNCAIKGMTSLFQRDAVNVLFHGTTVEDYLGKPVTKSMASHCVRGRAPIPEKVRDEVCDCSRDDLIDRFRVLEIQDIDICYQATNRLVQVCGLSDSVVKTLSPEDISEEARYAYIAEVYRVAIKCPRLSVYALEKEQLEFLFRLRDEAIPELTDWGKAALSTQREHQLTDTEWGDLVSELFSTVASNEPEKELPKRKDNSFASIDDLFADSSDASFRETVVFHPNEQEKYESLFGMSPYSGLINLDAADVAAVFRTIENCEHEYRFFCCKGKHDAVIEMISLAFRGRVCDSCLMNYIGSSDITLWDFEAAGRVLYENTDPDAFIACGAEIDSMKQGDDVEVWLLCGFKIINSDDVPEPLGPLFDSPHEEKEAEIDINEAFRDIEAIFNQRDRELRGRKKQ